MSSSDRDEAAGRGSPKPDDEAGEGSRVVDDEAGGDKSAGPDAEAGGGEPAGTDDEEWRFSIDEVGPDGVTEDTSTPGPIEPEGIDPVHALFVAVGVMLTIVLVFSGI